jgi:hypothetical protein
MRKRGTRATAWALWLGRHGAGLTLEQLRQKLDLRSYAVVAMQVYNGRWLPMQYSRDNRKRSPKDSMSNVKYVPKVFAHRRCSERRACLITVKRKVQRTRFEINPETDPRIGPIRPMRHIGPILDGLFNRMGST